MTVVRITDTSTRAEIEEAIAGLRAKMQRMPSHWMDRRELGRRFGITKQHARALVLGHKRAA